MATVRQRGSSWNTFWPLGGRRGGATQSTTWPDEPTARRAADIAKAHRHNITKQQVEDLILGPVTPDPEETKPESLAPLLRVWVEQWLASKTMITPNTLGGYEAMMRNRVLPLLGEMHMDEITGLDVANLIHDLRATPMREGTVTRYFAILHAAFEAAIKAQRTTHVTRNPCDETDFKRNQRAHDDDGSDDADPVYLTPDQYRRLRSEFEAHYQPLLDFLVGTGARWSEATAVAIQAIELQAKRNRPPEVHILRAWKKTKKGGSRYLGSTKGKRKRDVPLPTWLVKVIKPRHSGRSVKALMFVTPAGDPLDYRNFLARVWNPAVARAMTCAEHPPPDRGGPVPDGTDPGSLCKDHGGTRTDGSPCGAELVPGMTRCRWHMGRAPDAPSECDCPDRLQVRATPHDLRHTYASWFLAGGGQMRVLQDLLGHESIRTTEIYSGLQPGSEYATVAALDAIWLAGVWSESAGGLRLRADRDAKIAAVRTLIEERLAGKEPTGSPDAIADLADVDLGGILRELLREPSPANGVSGSAAPAADPAVDAAA